MPRPRGIYSTPHNYSKVEVPNPLPPSMSTKYPKYPRSFLEKLVVLQATGERLQGHQYKIQHDSQPWRVF